MCCCCRRGSACRYDWLCFLVFFLFVDLLCTGIWWTDGIYVQQRCSNVSSNCQCDPVWVVPVLSGALNLLIALLFSMANLAFCSLKVYSETSVFTVRRCANAVYDVVVCLSVCLSVTRPYCTKMANCRITQTTPYDSPWTLVFWSQRSRWIPIESPQVECQLDVG